jgi:hypothetical protein
MMVTAVLTSLILDARLGAVVPSLGQQFLGSAMYSPEWRQVRAWIQRSQLAPEARKGLVRKVEEFGQTT